MLITERTIRLPTAGTRLRRAVVDGVTADLRVTSLRYATDAEAASARWARPHFGRGWMLVRGRDVVVRSGISVSEIARTATAIEQLRGGDLAGFGESMRPATLRYGDDYEVSVGTVGCSGRRRDGAWCTLVRG